MSHPVLAVSVFLSLAASSDTQRLRSSRFRDRVLSLDERVGYQRAIEEVYWRHRIWPTQNGTMKPDLESVMPAGALLAKVEDYLAKSRALRVHWQHSIRPEQLQAEMDRMAQRTKQPGMLRELWAALGNDSQVIAECLARPVLADRLIRNWYARLGLIRRDEVAGLFET